MAVKAWTLFSEIILLFQAAYKIFRDLKQVIIFESIFLILQESILDVYFLGIRVKRLTPSQLFVS